MKDSEKMTQFIEILREEGLPGYYDPIAESQSVHMIGVHFEVISGWWIVEFELDGRVHLNRNHSEFNTHKNMRTAARRIVKKIKELHHEASMLLGLK